MTGNPRNVMVCDTPYLQNEFGDPRFFYVFNLILSFSTCSQSFKKICAWELLGANVLKYPLRETIVNFVNVFVNLRPRTGLQSLRYIYFESVDVDVIATVNT